MTTATERRTGAKPSPRGADTGTDTGTFAERAGAAVREIDGILRDAALTPKVRTDLVHHIRRVRGVLAALEMDRLAWARRLSREPAADDPAALRQLLAGLAERPLEGISDTNRAIVGTILDAMIQEIEPARRGIDQARERRQAERWQARRKRAAELEAAERARFEARHREELEFRQWMARQQSQGADAGGEPEATPALAASGGTR